MTTRVSPGSQACQRMPPPAPRRRIPHRHRARRALGRGPAHDAVPTTRTACDASRCTRSTGGGPIEQRRSASCGKPLASSSNNLASEITYRLRTPYVMAANNTIQPIELPSTKYSSPGKGSAAAASALPRSSSFPDVAHVNRSIAAFPVIAAARAVATGGVCITRRHVMYGVDP